MCIVCAVGSQPLESLVCVHLFHSFCSLLTTLFGESVLINYVTFMYQCEYGIVYRNL